MVYIPSFLKNLIKETKTILNDVKEMGKEFTFKIDVDAVKHQILDNRLGQILVINKIITRSQLRTALEISDTTGMQLGTVLVKEGFCEQKDVNSALLQQRKRNRLGQLLLYAGIINKYQLEKALHIQEETNKYLGQILIEQGFCSYEKMVAILKIKNEMYQLGQMLLLAETVTEEQLKTAMDLQQKTGKLLGDVLVEKGYVTKAKIISAIKRQKYQNRVGNILLRMNVITNKQLEKALQIQNITGRLLGNILIQEGYCTEEDLTKVLKYKRELNRIGKILVNAKVINNAQINEALSIQEITGQKLGDILVNLGYTTHERIEEILKNSEQFERGHLGQHLLKAGIITEEHLKMALEVQESTNQSLGEILVALGACTSEQVAGAIDSQSMVLKIVESILQ